MTKEQFLNKVKEIGVQMDKEVHEVRCRLREEENKAEQEYIVGNAKYTIGDIITDGDEIICVTKRYAGTKSGIGPPPSDVIIVYYGNLYTKKMTPRKDGQRAGMTESEHLKLIGTK